MNTVTWVRSVADIDAGRWNALVGRNRLICRHEHLLAVERSGINDCEYFYPVVQRAGEIVAHACVYTIRTELDSFAQGLLKAGISAIRDAWQGFLTVKTMECGTPTALGNTICIRPDMDRQAVLSLIVRDIEKLAARLRIGTLFLRDFDPEDAGDFEDLRRLGYAQVENLPEARLELRWRTFDDYLAAMRSQYRCKLLVQKRKFSQANLRIEVIEDFASCAEDLAALWRNAYDRAKEYRREVLTPGFFRNMDTYLGSRSKVVLATLDGRAIGFLLLLLDDDFLTTLFSGLDYSRSRDNGVYFNLFYKAIELAMAAGMTGIRFGITTLEPKLDLGAKTVPLFIFMKHRNPVLHPIVPRAFAWMTPECTLSSRRVWKQ